ncbi:TPA: hypothetical protein ACGO1T_001015 [Streptococcus suis]
MVLLIKEYIEFHGFNSKELGLYLVTRDAPTPEEKEVIEDIPFKQGVLDFSMILGERTFNNREITYEFIAPWMNYGQRKKLERTIKQLTMRHGRSRLYDTHDQAYYWLGKCKSVEVEDDEEYKRLIIKIVFDCYPFMFTYYNYFDDVWDTFDFEEGIANFTKYEIRGTKQIYLFNTGTTSVAPTVITDAPITVSIDGRDYQYQTGTSEDYVLGLSPGENILTVTGNATVSFRYAAEVMG